MIIKYIANVFNWQLYK